MPLSQGMLLFDEWGSKWTGAPTTSTNFGEWIACPRAHGGKNETTWDGAWDPNLWVQKRNTLCGIFKHFATCMEQLINNEDLQPKILLRPRARPCASSTPTPAVQSTPPAMCDSKMSNTKTDEQVRLKLVHSAIRLRFAITPMPRCPRIFRPTPYHRWRSSLRSRRNGLSLRKSCVQRP